MGLFSVLDQSEVQAIKKICVFGSSGNEAVYINEEDDVYAPFANIKHSWCCFSASLRSV
jgi:RCC1 and BTB domain-containing protein